ncbi:aldehyde dehydrogenase family protein [Escherichia coli]
MELGGKAPVIVFDDADIEAVVEGVRTFWLLQCRTGLYCGLSDLRAKRHLRYAGGKTVLRWQR